MQESVKETFAVGRAVGRYTIERVLGRRGAASEFAAVSVDGAAVHVRVLDETFADDPEIRRRFEREARLAGGVTHPNLVGVLETGVHEGLPYLVQARIGGCSLAELLVERGRLGAEEAITLARRLAGALESLHDGGIVHRDVCPANVRVTANGEPHLTGLGLAKDIQGTALTEAGTALGSVDYMAPEQIRGEPVGPPADVYALSCVTFECVCGRPPFGDRKGMRVLWAHLQDEPPDAAALAPELPDGLGDALRAGLEKDQRRRPQTAPRLADLLERGLGREAGS